MPVEFMKFYNAKTALNDIKSDVDALKGVLSSIESTLASLQRRARGERRLMARGGGGYYEYVRFTYFNYTIDVHVIPPATELSLIMSGIRDKLRVILDALNKSMSLIERISDEAGGLSLIGVAVEDGRVKVILIP
jgi:hypothetical protein